MTNYYLLYDPGDEDDALPAMPTDAEIVAAYEQAQRHDVDMSVGGIKVGDLWIEMAWVQAAWSRELNRRAAK